MPTTPAAFAPRPSTRDSRRGTLAADLHALGLATASDAVRRDLAVLSPAIVRELGGSARHAALVARVWQWESDVTGQPVAEIAAVYS